MNPRIKNINIRARLLVVIAIIAALLVGICVKLIKMDTVQRNFLTLESNQQSIHTIIYPATRGIIFDRNGIPLAVSTPMYTLVLDPKVLLSEPIALQRLLQNPLLRPQAQALYAAMRARPDSRYLLAGKNLTPWARTQIRNLYVPGVYLEQTYKTYYPTADMAAQLVGFTNVNNKGQDGLELTFNKTLQGTTGKVRLYENAIGQILGVAQVLQEAKPGQNITLSIDARLQYVAYAALRDQVIKTEAINGSAVVINPYTGEVLAAVSYPSFNPNDLNHRIGSAVRDAAITDIFEPGSTMKVFTISEALKSGKYTPTTPIDTNPGWILIQGHRIYDDSDNGLIDVTRVLKFSSNVGATKIALSLPWSDLYTLLQAVGFGKTPAGGFPGAENGLMLPFKSLSQLEYCTMAFGYAIAVSTLQLAHGYTVVAADGMQYPITFLKQTTQPVGVRLLPKWDTVEMRHMLLTVVQPGGTAVRANIPNYTVVGKTGTTNKVGPNGQLEARAHNAMFAGMLPIDHPDLVIVVHINNPVKGFGAEFGGISAAPVFSKIAQSAMVMMGIPANANGAPRAVAYT